jgi:glutamate-1-semialdehyde 2,1-aminomutase
MALFDPAEGPPVIRHPGSYNANPVSLSAAATTLELLTPEAVSVLNARGASLRRRIADTLSAAGVTADVTGLGSLFAIHFTDGPVRDFPSAARADAAVRHRLFLGLYNQGVLVDPRGVGCASLATGDAEIDRFAERLESVLARLASRGPVPTAS